MERESDNSAYNDMLTSSKIGITAWLTILVLCFTFTDRASVVRCLHVELRENIKILYTVMHGVQWNDTMKQGHLNKEHACHFPAILLQPLKFTIPRVFR